MENVKYRDFARRPNDYMGERVDIIGRYGIIGSLFPPVLSDKECQTKEKLSDNKENQDKINKELAEEAKKKFPTMFIETEEIMPEDLKKKEKKCKPVKTFFNPMPKSKSTK